MDSVCTYHDRPGCVACSKLSLALKAETKGMASMVDKLLGEAVRAEEDGK